MNNHTPEPWFLRERDYQLDYEKENMEIVGGLVGQDYQTVCNNMEYGALPLSVEDMQRIVACVNACAGVEDPEKEIAQLRANNKILRDALERLAKLGNEPHYGNSIGNDIAREALNKTKEGE